MAYDAALQHILRGLVFSGAISDGVLCPRWVQFLQFERDFSSSDALPWNNPLPLDRLLAFPAVYDTAREINDAGDRVGLLQTVLLIAAVPAAVYA